MKSLGLFPLRPHRNRFIFYHETGRGFMAKGSRLRFEVDCPDCGHRNPAVQDRKDDRVFYLECVCCGKSERLTVDPEEECPPRGDNE
jgi:Zn ribbon nucleic-acid-binding protein